MMSIRVSNPDEPDDEDSSSSSGNSVRRTSMMNNMIEKIDNRIVSMIEDMHDRVDDVVD